MMRARAWARARGAGQDVSERGSNLLGNGSPYSTTLPSRRLPWHSTTLARSWAVRGSGSRRSGSSGAVVMVAAVVAANPCQILYRGLKFTVLAGGLVGSVD